MKTRLLAVALLAAGAITPLRGQESLSQEIDRLTSQVLPKVVEWRRDFHQHPELSNREFRTSKIVAEQLRRLGIEVRTGVAKTGVVGVLKGAKPGPVVALRADMDGLPVTEEVDLPFKSTARDTYNGQQVGVMHACGHDNHISILLGAAEVLAGMRDRLPGTVKFIFQPSEEGAPDGEEGGARVMIREGALENPRPGAIFGLHVWPKPVGHLSTKPMGFMAASDTFKIRVRGRQTHGALPWAGVDPVVVSSQIVLALQTLISRQSDLTVAPAIVTVGRLTSGVRANIVPDSAEMEGTIRTFDPKMQEEIHRRMKRTAELIAQSAGATAEVEITLGNPVTFNDARLTEQMIPTLKRVAGEGKYATAFPTTPAEDFSFYQKEIPGLFFFLGITPGDADPANVAANHSPRFFADEGALPVGIRAMANLAVDYLTAK